MIAQLRPATEDTIGTCDWGGCNRLTTAERYDPQTNQWLAVCDLHGSKPRNKHQRGTCQTCQKTRALDTMGNLFLHSRGFDTCPGSRRPPATHNEGTNG